MSSTIDVTLRISETKTLIELLDGELVRVKTEYRDLSIRMAQLQIMLKAIRDRAWELHKDGEVMEIDEHLGLWIKSPAYDAFLDFLDDLDPMGGQGDITRKHPES